ncbi:nitroreductase [Pseudonocardia benzenivorans]|uniref:Putative NAD(P)H nitroreductase n=2 Tax=Pseudonocardia TaxID=1847 RepID=F4CPV5_PSEUX|nr:nitroreductase [Pseudonocardia dioxanivorans]AEA26138.1 nitroreductase [Pseudonocardia dioxanivorans CB1190]
MTRADIRESRAAGPRATLARDASDVLAALRERRSCPGLTLPGPDHDELRAMLEAAVSAPDHGRLRPWRFIVVDAAARTALGDALADAHAERDPAATPEELDRVRAKAHRAPTIVVVVAAPQPHPKVPAWEQRASAVCVAHGVVLAADALGYGAIWRTGWFGEAPKVRAHLGLAAHEDVTGWIYLGTPVRQQAPRTPTEPAITWLT